ncbi:MAG: hypothetical protein JWM62_1515, partial [Frankiales bacterium]|nr:hypothetical protein [Frankiales bacterium]
AGARVATLAPRPQPPTERPGWSGGFEVEQRRPTP